MGRQSQENETGLSGGKNDKKRTVAVDTVRPFKAPHAVKMLNMSQIGKTLNSEDKPKVFHNKTDWKDLE